MKHQEQVLERDLGIPGDLLYRAWSYTANPSTCPTGTANYVGPGEYYLAYPLYFRGMSERTNKIRLTNTLGYQVFDSTTNPIPKFNYCRNQKLRLKCYPVGHWQYYKSVSCGEQCVGAPFYRYALPVGTVIPKVPEIIDWSESAQASSRAWWEMQPRFQGDFDGLNFLFELKDFKDIAKAFSALRPSQIEGSLKRAKRMIQEAQRAVRKGSATARVHQTAAAATKLASEAILIKHFAIDPTVKDLMTLHGQLANLVSDVQRRFCEKGKTANRRHYSEKIAVDDRMVPETGVNQWRQKGLVMEDNFTATMEFTYDYKLRGLTDALKRYYGGEMNAEVVWNAIPFSFLVDYFIKIGDAISRMTTDPNVVLSMSQYCESRRVSIKSGIVFNGSCSQTYNWATIINGQVALDNMPITAYEGTLYERRVVPPRKGMALPKVKLPSCKQALNIAALVRCMW